MQDLTFFELVKAMREAQRIYFKTRTQKALTEAKAAEHAVDTAIQRAEHPAPTPQPVQPELDIPRAPIPDHLQEPQP